MNHIVMLMGGAPAGGGTAGNPILGFLPLIAIILIMYLLMIRPQAKKQKEHKAMLAALKKGDRVVTAGGIFGTIAGIKENENIVIVKIAENVKVELSRGSIGQVIQKS